MNDFRPILFFDLVIKNKRFSYFNQKSGKTVKVGVIRVHLGVRNN